MQKAAVVLLKSVLEVLCMLISLKAWDIGVNLGIKIFQVNLWMVNFLMGLIMTVSVHYLLGKLLSFINFFMDASLIWMECCPGEKLLTAFKAVIGNLQESISVAVLNKAVRKVIMQIFVHLKENTVDLPILNGLSKSPLMKMPLTILSIALDYVDECVLAWCYKHDNSFLTECAGGLLSFIKCAPKILAKVTSVTLLQVVLKVFVYAMAIIYILKYRSIAWYEIVPCYIFLRCVCYIIDSAIFKTVMMASIVKAYVSVMETSNTDTTADERENLLNEISSIVDTSELESIMRRFCNGNKGGNCTDTSENSD